MIVEPDQQVGTEADALPKHVELEEIDRDDKSEHRCREQRDERKEPPHPLVVLHIADGVNVDKQRNQRHNDEHHCRERVDEHAHRQLYIADLRPERLHHVRIVHRDLIVHGGKRDKDGERERERHHRDRDRRGEILLLPRERSDDEKCQCGEERDQIGMRKCKCKHIAPLP